MAKAKKRYVRNVIEERKRNLLTPEGLDAYRENPLGWYTSPLMRESFAPGSKKRSDRKGHGTGVKDYMSLEEMSKLPLRSSLAPGKKGPQNTYRIFNGSGGIPVIHSGVIDDRTEEERAAQEAWDERMAEINQGRDDRLKARKKEQIRRAQDTARGEPTKWAEPSREPTPPAAQEQNQSAVSNGTRQQHDAGKKEKKGTGGAQGQTPPKGANVSTGHSRYGSTPGESGVVVDGAPVAANNTAARDNVAAAQRESTKVNEINAEQARKDAQSRAYDADRRREAREIRDRVARGEEREQYYANREAARKAAAEQARKERMDQRYKEGKLSSVDDWENLGRGGSNRRNYSAVEGETDAQKAEREKDVAKRDARIEELRRRAIKMADKTLLKEGETLSWDPKTGARVVTRTVKNAEGKDVTETVGDDELDKRKIKGYGNEGFSYAKDSFYSNNPAKMRGLENLRKVFEDSHKAGTLTDKQIDAFAAKLDSWDAEAKGNRKRIDAANAEREMRQQLELRQKYGMTDKDPGTGQYLVSDDDLKAYDEKVRGEVVKKTLGEMATRGPVDTEQGYREYGKSWQTLMENGINMPQARADAFKALSPEARAEYNRQVHEAASEDERDTVKQNLVLNYLYKKNGITRDDPTMGTVLGHDVAKLNSQAIAEHNDRPGNVSEIAEPASMRDLPDGQMAALAPRPAVPEKPSPTVPDVAGTVPVKPRVAAPVAPTAAPAAAEGQGLADVVRKKKEESQTAYRGGFAAPLRPRHFRG